MARDIEHLFTYLFYVYTSSEKYILIPDAHFCIASLNVLGKTEFLSSLYICPLSEKN